jgi:hypothetical protein
MPKSATDLMQDIIFASIIDAIAALKTASKGLPNNLLRDLNAVHANTTLVDLPAEVQAAIQANIRAAFTRLQREGYVVAPAGISSMQRPAAPAGVDRTERRPRPGPPRGGRPTPDRKPPVVERKPRRGGPRDK